MGNSMLCLYTSCKDMLCQWGKTVPMHVGQDGPYVLYHMHMVLSGIIKNWADWAHWPWLAVSLGDGKLLLQTPTILWASRERKRLWE